MVYTDRMSNTVGKQIRELRKQAGWTLRELADRADISHSALAKIETVEDRNPRIETLKKIADALEVSIKNISGGLVVEPLREYDVDDLRFFLSRIPELSETEVNLFCDAIEGIVKRRRTPEGQKELRVLRQLEKEAREIPTEADLQADLELQVEDD